MFPNIYNQKCNRNQFLPITAPKIIFNVSIYDEQYVRLAASTALNHTSDDSTPVAN